MDVVGGTGMYAYIHVFTGSNRSTPTSTHTYIHAQIHIEGGAYHQDSRAVSTGDMNSPYTHVTLSVCVSTKKKTHMYIHVQAGADHQASGAVSTGI
jgi:hypothetical protein